MGYSLNYELERGLLLLGAMKRLIPLAVLVLLGSSCIKEQREDCPSLTSISHYFTLHNDGGDRIDEHVDSLKILIFDSVGVFAYYGEEIDPTINSSTQFKLPASSYQLLTIGGDHSNFTILDATTMLSPVVGVTELKNIEVCVPQLEDGTHQSEPSNLFLSNVTDFTALAASYSYCDVGLIKMVKSVTLRVIGANTHTATITIPHSIIGYDGYPTALSGNVVYQEEGEVSGDTVIYTYKTLRLYLADSVATISLDFYADAPQNGMHRVDNEDTSIGLMSAITDNPDYSSQDDIDSEDNFDVEVDYTSGVEVVVSVNGWTVQNVTPY